MNKLIITPMALSLLAFALTGCGEGEDAIFGSGGSNELRVSSFEGNANNIARIDTTYRTGKRQVQPTNIIGIAQPNINNLERSLVLANGFEGTLEDKDISVSGNKVSQPIYRNNSNSNSNSVSAFTTDYQEYDLFNIRAGSYKVDEITGKRTGVLTDLYNYSRIDNNVSFPKGAKCYTPETNSEREFVYFNEKNITGYKQIKPWIDFIENQIGSNYSKRIIRTDLGFNKQYSVARVQAYNDNQQNVATYNGIEYKDRVYNVNHVASGFTSSNREKSNDVVNCTIVNKVDADFLVTQIKKYY